MQFQHHRWVSHRNLQISHRILWFGRHASRVPKSYGQNIKSCGKYILFSWWHTHCIKREWTRTWRINYELDKENLALKLSKCEFFQQEVNWLGHKLSMDGISPKITKTEAILKLSPPTSLKQLRSFLGSINHLAKFIPNAATLTEKLRPLLCEENEKKKLKSVKN